MATFKEARFKDAIKDAKEDATVVFERRVLSTDDHPSEAGDRCAFRYASCLRP
jgi:hypothetical protein